ncbi:DUF6186 family protein [Actinocrispum wychmicini]|uniref:Uncharacterized protein n=1 Tax=Actinocrispum wychmicini TaxID=1213861 RepID=A0A4R2JKN1_9PSEU|nr:DUF6186 family protein [Actinocrispum wychmicini]TCO60593.1 hypothetical protein EV192_103168 [Actinocrispum wychmicini]
MTARVVTELGFGLIVLAAVALAVASHVAPRRIPPLTSVLAVVMRRRTTRIALVAAWWWVGWHFFVGH